MNGGGWRGFVRANEDEQPTISRMLLQRVWGYARPYRSGIIVVLITIFIGTLLDRITPLLVRHLIDVAIPERNLGRLNLVAVGLVAIPLIGGLLDILQRRHSSLVGEGIIFDLRRALYSHMQRMSLRFFTSTKSGELVSRLNNDVVGSQRAVTGTLITLITNVITVSITLFIMLTIEWRLTLLALLVLPLFMLPARRVGRIVRNLTRSQMQANGEMNGLMGETLNVSGALLVKIFGRRNDEVAKFSQHAGEVRDLGIRTALVMRSFFVMVGLVSAVGVTSVYWFGGYLAITSDNFSTGDIIALALYLPGLYGAISTLVNTRVELASSLVSFERVFEILDLPLEIVDAEQPQILQTIRGEVQFEHVWFRYQADEINSLSSRDGQETTVISPITTREWALSDIDFTAKPGQLVALVGPSGAGKTSLTYLLPRLYDPSRGRVLIDGIDVRELELDSLGQAIGMVTQETFLFHESLRANLRYAKPDATDAELEAACRAANIHDLIASLPNGYDTVVGERGYRFSGGEKQRIAIARVILKNPRILVLDEATSALDSRSEALIQAALQPLLKDRTSIVIAHRLSTILAADLILVVDQGRVLERGTHSELLAQAGLYAQLYQTQFKEREQALEQRA
ncbi:MAG TPA: ABC transporter ATP-binding protein [Herpetosiphon sp.]|uniref:ABC transporter related n=1 Tax=Herpetosiphon aurantiacus (strain ATCC 23779 / DSM 785 / 114-95) TaxID=316274 RepID=A9B7L6_HERA2|nr:ABC transporter ATP-binding protein [Herpetosiphon sp.]ABX02989.1 ABC transporter related [Herpetosiphon aurantiacus DSM 785]HBW50910.1 ABC transporter ATP-binding protein [Herpetosiphon sp.]